MPKAKSLVFLFIFSALFLFTGKKCQAWKKLSGNQTFDVVVLGATPGGIAAAIQAARMGMKVALIDRNKYPGRDFQSLPFLESQNEGGFYKELSDSLRHAFTREWKALPDYSEANFYSPSLASNVWEELIRKESNLTYFRSCQFDPLAENIRNPPSGGPTQIRVINTRRPAKSYWIAAKIWIDGTREGDLAAAFGCRIRTGVETEGEFNLTGEEKLRAGNSWSATPQDSVKWSAFLNNKPSIRIGLTRNPEKKSIRKPERYKREEFSWLFTALQNGLLTRFLSDPGRTKSLFQRESTLASVNTLNEMVPLPEILSTNACKYSNLTWSQRDSIQAKARLFVQGLLWFAQNDTSLTDSFREEALQFGLPKSEFKDSDHFPPSILLPVGSRVEGKTVFTEKDWISEAGKRPVIHRNSVAIGMNQIKKEGMPGYDKIYFTVPYETIVPVEKEQILCPVPFFATLDAAQNPAMEGVRLELGQAAGVAAAVAIRKAICVSNVPVDSIQIELIRMKTNLVFLNDVSGTDPDFELAQKAGILGWFSDNSARLNAIVERKDLELWSVRSGFSQKEITELVGISSRRDALKALLKKYQDQWKAKL
ncbi:MAG TPA: FAD-dependent oxidoreductase [Catalimonadaceae bacterium]|nr:FAD-dependent oxidoreductase [Catalimonadaceae bacterium]